jgi:cell division GTPase FtsZ
MASNSSQSTLTQALLQPGIREGASAIAHPRSGGRGPQSDTGRWAAIDTKEEIQGRPRRGRYGVRGGPGGGIGTGAAPVIADIAREMGVLPSAWSPSRSCSKVCTRIAEEGLNALKEKVDSIIVIRTIASFRSRPQTPCSGVSRLSTTYPSGRAGHSDLITRHDLINAASTM